MRKTFKYRLYPTIKQKKALQASLDACRWVYNKTLEIKKKSWEEKKESISLYSTSGFIPQWKEENLNLLNTNSQCLQNSQMRVDLAFKAFFRRIKSGDTPGYPRFKGFNRYNSFTFSQSGFALINNRLRISKVGFVKIKKHRVIEGTIKTLTIHRTPTGKWFASFSCEVLPHPLPKTNKVIGIDLGLKSFATFSTGIKIKNPKFFKACKTKLAKLQRRLSKSEKGSNDRIKQRKKVAHLYEKITNKRQDFAHKLSRKIVNAHQVIVFEKLNIKKMQENGFKPIRKGIDDVAWNQFIQFTTYKAVCAGRTVLLVDPKNTSKRCSRCGQLVEKSLSDRVHRCSCGLIMDRDHNAAINILALGMQSLAKA